MRNIKKVQEQHNGMRVTVHYTKKWAYTVIALICFALPALIVYAFQSGQQPSVFGHSSNEIQFNVTYLTPTRACAMSSYELINNSNGTTYCSLKAFDDDSTAAFAGPECDIRRRTDGLWEYQFNVGCGQTNCFVHCIKINTGE